MDILKELYTRESYFLTQKGLDLGDRKWLDKHLISFASPSPEIYSALLNLFRRLLRLCLKDHPGTKLSVRNNKTKISIALDHPVITLLQGTANVPHDVSANIRDIVHSNAAVRLFPHLVRRRRYSREYLTLRGYGSSSGIFGFTGVSFSVGTVVVQLRDGIYFPDRYLGGFSAATIRNSAKLPDVPLISVLNEVLSYIAALDSLYAELNTLLGPDIELITNLQAVQFPLLSYDCGEDITNLNAFSLGD